MRNTYVYTYVVHDILILNIFIIKHIWEHDWLSIWIIGKSLRKAHISESVV